MRVFIIRFIPAGMIECDYIKLNTIIMHITAIVNLFAYNFPDDLSRIKRNEKIRSISIMQV